MRSELTLCFSARAKPATRHGHARYGRSPRCLCGVVAGERIDLDADRFGSSGIDWCRVCELEVDRVLRAEALERLADRTFPSGIPA